ncbi:MAG: site-specific DNA-methyltransferase, partial [Treponema sp.]|nr:site-specific DNA-methyltransferase [Treponema sp.]
FLEISKNRREEIDDLKIREEYREKIIKYSDKPLHDILEFHDDAPYFGIDLPVM